MGVRDPNSGPHVCAAKHFIQGATFLDLPHMVVVVVVVYVFVLCVCWKGYLSILFNI